jgi:hypothetical protein
VRGMPGIVVMHANMPTPLACPNISIGGISDSVYLRLGNIIDFIPPISLVKFFFSLKHFIMIIRVKYNHLVTRINHFVHVVQFP